MSIREDITNTIIALIESGAARGSSSPLWDAAASLGMPLNFSTRQAYSGINVPLLWGAAQERGFDCNEWLTFKQAQSLGGRVRKGAKGVLCAFYKVVESREERSVDEGDRSGFAMLKPFWVFNVAEIDGLQIAARHVLEPFDPIERAEALLQASGVPITWQGTRAFYRPSTDEIYMPSRDRFSSATNAYAVALHEATHSTGHPSRLNREFGTRFGSEAYAFEELVAELGSAFLVAHLGLEGAKMQNHASYIENWLRVLRSDSSAVFAASKHASAAFRHLVGPLEVAASTTEQLLAA